jgi:histidine ammonia-lyase
VSWHKGRLKNGAIKSYLTGDPMKALLLTGANLTMESTWEVSQGLRKVELDVSSRGKMQESRDYIEGRIRSGEVMYGVNTGFGAFSSVRISDSEIEELVSVFVF